MNNIEALFIRRNEHDVVWSRIDDMIMMILPGEEKDKVFKLNKTAACLWEGFDGRTRTGEIIENLCAQFDSDSATVLRDAEAFIHSMEELQLISISSEPC